MTDVQIINNKNGEQQIKFTSKVLKQVKKIKGRSDNVYYQAIMPEPLVEAMDFKKSLFFYNVGEDIFISPIAPDCEYKEIKLQKLRRFSLPRTYFPFCENKEVTFTYYFDKLDVASNKLGCLCIQLTQN